MRIKKFVADTAKEALLQVREELGPKAVILKTQKAPVKSFMGLLGKNQVEVTAALDDGLFAKPEAKGAKAEVPKSALPDLDLYTRKGTRPENESENENATPRNGGLNDEKFRLLEIHEDVEEVKSVLRNLADHIRNQNMPPLPEKIASICSRLIQQEISEKLAIRVALKLQGLVDESEANDERKIEQKAKEIMAASIQASGPFVLKDKRASRVMLVGPTGAGKTTTLAKLAAQYGILQRKRVRIITADTYRIAAVEQLRTFAQISDIPMTVVYTPEEMREAVVRMAPSSDLILIDTAGRSQHHAEHMADLQEMVEAAEPDELHLVLSATTKQADLYEIADRYRLLGVNRYLFTKLDETTRYGAIYNLLCESKSPFSYLTTGQSVPDDIEEGKAIRLVQMLFSGKMAETA